MKKKLEILAVVAVIAALISFNAIPAWAQTTWNVPGDNTGTCTTGNPSCDTIQDAIDAASPSDTINVATGTYNERLVIGKSLTLLGAQTGVDPTATGARTFPAAESTITEAGLPTPNPDILIKITSGTSDVTIDGFTLNGDQFNTIADTSVIRCGGSAGTANNITISNNIIDGMKAVIYKGGTGLTFDHNHVTANKNGIVAQPNTATNAVISNNIFVLGGNPIGGEDAIHLSGTVDSNVIGNTATGFVNGKGVAGSGQTNLAVSGNTFTGNKDAVSFWGNTTFVDINNNELSNSLRYGINIKGQDITITGNLIMDNADRGVNIAKHTISTERVMLRCNNISNNTNYGVKVDTANVTEIVNAVNNWWGAADGPSGEGTGAGDAVSEGVDFTPWLNGPAPAVPDAYTCVGFEAPMNKGALKVRKNKVLPLKMVLIDGDGFPVTDADISSPPVIQVIVTPLVGDAADVTDDALSSGKGTIGNQLYFDSAGGKWAYNLMTKNYTTAGTYTITVVSGNACEYSVDTCTAEFVIE